MKKKSEVKRNKIFNKFHVKGKIVTHWQNNGFVGYFLRERFSGDKPSISCIDSSYINVHWLPSIDRIVLLPNVILIKISLASLHTYEVRFKTFSFIISFILSYKTIGIRWHYRYVTVIEAFLDSSSMCYALNATWLTAKTMRWQRRPRNRLL